MDQKTILIVDDSPGNLQLLRMILKANYQLYFAKNGDEALERVQQHRLDLILLDVMMPGMDGYEVCTKIKQREEYKEIPVLFVSALRPDEGEKKCMEVGAVGYIAKPIEPIVVRQRVKELIG